MQHNAFIRTFLAALTLGLCVVPAVKAQTQGATFGDVIYLGGTPSDIVVDDVRERLYLVNAAASRIDIYDYRAKAIIGNIRVGSQPLAAGMSMDGGYLYVSNNLSSSLSVVDLGTNSVIQTVSLPARPEGVSVGVDGRVLITTQGTGANATQNTLTDLRSDATAVRAGATRSVSASCPDARWTTGSIRASRDSVPRQIAAYA